MKRLILTFFALIFASIAGAQVIGGPGDPCPVTPNSLCGMEAVGRMEDGRCWKGYVAMPTTDGVYQGTAAVSAQGKWFMCKQWIKPGQPATTPEPKPGCLDATAYETWTDKATGLTCTSRPAGTTTSPSKLKAAAHGAKSWVWDDEGREQGGYAGVCNAGKWERYGSFCHRR